MPVNSNIRLSDHSNGGGGQRLTPVIPGQNYQYLLPARESGYAVPGEADPVYEKLSAITASPDNRLCVVSGDGQQPLIESDLVKNMLSE